MSRWIRLQTSIFDHELFAGKEFSERDAWVWLIAKAAWRETRHRVGKDMAVVPVGSLYVTLRELQMVWRWRSDFRVRSFLKLLQNERMIAINSNAGKTQITICNYERFQNPERTENAEETQEKRTENALKTPVIPIHQNSLRESAVAENFDFDGFEDWFSAWPTALTDDKIAASAQWHGLTPEQRSAAKTITPSYIEAVKASGRKAWPPAAKYLAQRLWERFLKLPAKKPKRGLQSDVATIIAGIRNEDPAAGRLPAKTPEQIKAEREAVRNAFIREAIENNRRQG